LAPQKRREMRPLGQSWARVRQAMPFSTSAVHGK
jgi:hypothetical protein